MKRIASAIFFACLALSLVAQQGIKVKYKGSKPTVTDFAWAAFPSLNYEDEEECGDRPWRALQHAMTLHSKGLPQEQGETLTIDTKNGYIVFESSDENFDHVFRLEVCYWNEADGKHKLIAFNDMASFTEGRPCVTETTHMCFYRYDNATKRMVACDPPGFEIDYSCTYELPRSGKDIVATQWDADGSSKRKVLKWNGRRFSY
jgi:hypothetical protein